MAALDALLKCTYGTTSFQLSDYSYSEDPIITADLGRTGTKNSVSGKGWVEGTDAADFAAKLAEVRNGFRTWGQDLTITGLGGTTEVQILAAYCRDAGPHVSFKMLEQGSGTPLIKEFEFTVQAITGQDFSGGGGGGAAVGYAVEVKSDGLRRIKRRGVITQAGASAIYHNNVLPSMLASYPASNWVATQSYDVDSRDTLLNYEISFEEIKEPFVTGSQFEVLDGDWVQRVERNADHLLVFTISFDFAYSGDPQRLLVALRPTGKTIVRERWQDQRYKDRRFTGEIVWVDSADMNNVADWEQSIEFDDGNDVLNSTVVPGRDPVLFYGSKPVRRAVQYGRAVGISRWVKAPSPFWTARTSGPGKITYKKINDSQWETAWRYEFMFSEPVPVDGNIFGRLNRPSVFAFAN